jgi:hypothetical protein
MVRRLLAAVLLALPALAAAAAPAASPGLVPDPAPADLVFRQWDANKDGSLSQEEFRAGWRALRQRAAAGTQARLRARFEQADGNDDQALDEAEYRALVLVRRAGAAARPLSRYDASQDGKLQFDEYLVLVRDMAPRTAAPPAGEKKP